MARRNREPEGVEVELEEEFAVDEFESLDYQAAVFDDDEALEECATHLKNEYEEAMALREELYPVWEQWRRNLEAEPKSRKKNAPYKNASNIVPPLTQTIMHTAYAYMKQMFDVKKPFWTVKSLQKDNPEDVKKAEFATRYLDMLARSRNDLYLEKVKQELLLEQLLMGTTGVKTSWQSYSKKSTYVDEEGVKQERTVWLHRGPKIEVTPIERFIWQPEAHDIASASWVAREITLAWYELKNREANGLYQNVDEIENWKARTGKRHFESEGVDKALARANADAYDVTEFSAYWDVDGDGEYEDIIVVMHVPSKTVLRVEYNPIIERDVVAGRFVTRTFDVQGRGIGQMTEHLQEEMTGIHNLRNDNMKFSAMRMMSMKRSTAQSNKESIYPGKIFLTDNPREDIQPISMGEVPPSSLQAEQNTMHLARETTGISSVMGGFSDPNLGTRDTFRGQQMRQQSSTNVFGSILTTTKEMFSQIGQLVLYQMAAHKSEMLEKERQARRLDEEELEMLEELLSVPVEDIPIKFGFEVQTTDIEQTFEAKRQNMLTMTQLFAQWAQETTPVAMQLFTPEGKQMQEAAPELYKHMLSIYMGSTRLMHEVFGFFDEEDTNRYLPDTERYQLLKDLMEELDHDLIKRKKMVLSELKMRHEQQDQQQMRQQMGMGMGVDMEQPTMREGFAPEPGMEE